MLWTPHLGRKLRSRWIVFLTLLFFVTIYTRLSAAPAQECFEEFILTGRVKSSCTFSEPKLNLVYSWANGSDALYDRIRQESGAERQQRDQPDVLLPLTSRKHQREHGELEVSMGSFRARLGVITSYILLSDFWQHGTWTHTPPTWSEHKHNLDTIIVPSSKIMAHEHLPVFNSLSMETHIGDVPGISGIIIYVNDDMFLNTPHATSDFYTPLSGPHFHISKTGFVDDAQDSAEDMEYLHSEWSSLRFTNKLLSEKFGNRSRGYVEHVAKPIAVDVLQEVSEVFAREISESDKHAFREGEQINMLFLATWYTIEMQRAVMLRSLLHYHYGSDFRAASRDLSSIESYLPRNPLSANLLTALKDIAVSLPISSTIDTLFLDGYPFEYVVGKSMDSCILDPICFYPDKGHDPIDWITSQVPECGDCLLYRSLATRDGTLGHLLPEREDASYQAIIDSIRRYSYGIAETEIEFINLKSLAMLDKQLQDALASKAAQICINDDLSDALTDAQSAFVDDAIKSFLREKFQ